MASPQRKQTPHLTAAPTAAVSLLWDDVTVGGWKELLKKAPRSNLLQTWAYAKTNLMLYRLWPKFGVFYENGVPVAMAFVATRRFLGLEVVQIHRAPVWLIPNPSPELILEVLQLLREAYPPKWSRRISFLPELPNTPQTNALLAKAGFTPRPKGGYTSSWLDLSPHLVDLKKRFSKSFQQSLKKAEQFDFKIIIDPSKLGTHDLIMGHMADRSRRNYKGASAKFLKTLHKNCRPHEWLLLEAWHDDVLMASQLFILHGSAATYQLGWTTERGRNACAHHGMLWYALTRLKQMGITGLDLGGLSPENAGLNTFKESLGGTTYTLTGLWK